MWLELSHVVQEFFDGFNELYSRFLQKLGRLVPKWLLFKWIRVKMLKKVTCI